MRGIVWFRRDLRLHDQPALTAACQECDEIVPLFVFDEPLLQSDVFGPACVNFMLGCLRELASSLAARGVMLQWRRGEPVSTVVQVAQELKADVVYWNRDYEPAAIERDRQVQLALAERGIRTKTFKDHVVFEAEEIRSATGEPLQRYSAYRARWWAKWQATKPSPLTSPAFKVSTSVPSRSASRSLPSPIELGCDPVVPWIDPGERQAQMRLQEFLGKSVHVYGEGRNRPGIDGSSRLSPHFRFGTLSVRTAVHEALAALAKGGRVSRADVLTWIDELVWRDFFQQVLSAFPHVAKGPFRHVAVPPVREPGGERDRLFQAWREGQTGYPIVDAGMRQLNRTGWMPNRVRMIAASFLIKDLRLDWQSGERYFMSQLLDADVAANNGNWQWCAATGTDAMRGHRIFNPALQSKKFDPGGEYICLYVPELAKVSRKWIHEPHLMPVDEQTRAGCYIGRDYPAPLVDHRQAREEYLSLGKQRTAR
ncbi:MAG: deoxyribodipyrimidine photo-lyase [Nitrospira sp.]|nr:deoxyribodipyrimidine photo-lyase [Nitrospira sp.]